MTSETPEQILGVADSATDEEVRAAYLRLVKQHPPDREPEHFERIRDAYETLRDPRRRARRRLLAQGPEIPLESLLEGREAGLRFAGPEAWLEALAERPAGREERG